MNKDQEQIVKNVISGFIKANKMFTAFDVTLWTRTSYDECVDIRHNEVRNFIKENYNDIFGFVNYTRSLIPIKSKNKVQNTFLYYPDIADPSIYHLYYDITKDNTGNTNDVNDSNYDKVVLEVTDENRVNIPKNMVKELGFNSGDIVFITDKGHNGKVFLSITNTPIYQNGVKKQIVNKDGRIRITVDNNLNTVTCYSTGSAIRIVS